MPLLYLILIVLVCVLLSAVVLIQNPKGGGLSGAFGGFGTQFMGVKQTNDILEKGTWLFAAILGVLCIVSTLFFAGSAKSAGSEIIQGINPNTNKTAPLTTPNNQQQNAVPLQQTDSGK